MKSLVTYYSYGGNTEKVAKIAASILKEYGGQPDLVKIKPKKEIKNFFAQCRSAFKRESPDIEDTAITDVSPYDLVVIGSPIWAFSSTPAVNTYLNKVNGLSGKKVVIFLTSGGTGVDKCFDYMEHILRSKGASTIHRVHIHASKVKDAEMVKQALHQALSF